MASIGSVFLNLGVKDKATKQMSSIFKGIQGQMVKFGAAFGAFNFFKTGIQQAATFAEAQNALNKLFSEDGVEAINKFAKTAAHTMGISEAEAVSMAAKFGGIFSEMPTQIGNTGQAVADLMQRVGDLGSLYETGNEEIFKGLQSALAGRISMTLQQMNVDLSQNKLNAELAAGAFAEYGFGIGTTMAQLDAASQKFIRFKSFMLQSKVAADDFVGSKSTSLPNQIKELGAVTKDAQKNIGQGLMPTIMKIMPVFEKMANFIGENTKLILGLSAAFVGFKLGSFVAKMGIAIAQLMGFMAAKVGAQTGIGAIVAVPAVVGTVGAIVGGLLGSSFLSGAGSGGGANPSQTNNRLETSVVVNVDPIAGRATSNSQGTNVSTNFGRGGS